MCGRFTLRSRLNVVIRELDLFSDLDGPPRYNVAPTQTVPIVRPDAERRRTLAAVRWGLVPSWAKEVKGAGFINARAETVATKPAFRSAFKKRRCLVLADGYYEWQAVGKQKQPYFIRRRDDRPFGFAGLWECRHGEDGTDLESCAVITTTANERTRSVHDRMPVILDPAEWDAWLASDATPNDLEALLRPYPSEALAVDPVSPLVNSAKNDLPECVRVCA
jgi:putative SOS response-associated peptidase YedK